VFPGDGGDGSAGEQAGYYLGLYGREFGHGVSFRREDRMREAGF
jgi:hypothetical protein